MKTYRSTVLVCAAVWAVACVVAGEGAFALDPKLPIFTVKYDGGYGSEENDEADEVEPGSYRHTVLLRVKEELSRDFMLNLYSALSRKRYLTESGSYLYGYVNPDMAWYIVESLKWYAGLRAKWVGYDELDTEGRSKDYGSYLAKTDMTIKPVDRLKLIPSLQGVWDVHENAQKSAQTYTAGLNMSSRFGGWELSGRFRGSVRLPLGGESDITSRFNAEVGLSGTWDPND